MRNPTEMMISILQNKVAQRIIDYVSPIYGDSYVGLWIYEVIGRALEIVVDIAEALKTEGNPGTAVLLLDYWEDYYHLPRDPTLTTEQRQLRIIAKIRARGPMNPARLESILSGVIGGIPVTITENVAKNTFLVTIHDAIDSINPIVAVLERLKPAHLIYWIKMEAEIVSEADIKTAIAIINAERDHYMVEVEQYMDRILAEAALKTAIAITQAQIFNVEVEQ